MYIYLLVFRLDRFQQPAIYETKNHQTEKNCKPSIITKLTGEKSLPAGT